MPRPLTAALAAAAVLAVIAGAAVWWWNHELQKDPCRNIEVTIEDVTVEPGGTGSDITVTARLTYFGDPWEGRQLEFKAVPIDNPSIDVQVRNRAALSGYAQTDTDGRATITFRAADRNQLSEEAVPFIEAIRVSRRSTPLCVLKGIGYSDTVPFDYGDPGTP